MFTIEHGSEVKSNITGFIGVTVARAEHLNGCNRYFVQPVVDKEGKLRDGMWVDEAELLVLKSPEIERKNNTRGGFPSKIR